MPKQLNVSLAFTADTSQARQQLQQLQQQLTQLTNDSLAKNKEFGLVKDINDATAAAAQLKVQLENATNVNTGKLDLGKFNDSLKQSGMSLADYKTQLDKLGPDGSKAFLSLAQSISNAEMPLRRTNALVKEFGVTLMNAARWQFSSSVLHGLMGAIQGAYGYAQDLDRSLTNISIVTGKSRDEMAAFAEQANKSAQALSTTTTAYTDAALIFYQQGIRDQSEIESRVETTIKLANVTGQSAENVSSYMTAIWNNFEDGSKSLKYYADVITALGASTASSSEEIAKGMQQFAAVANTVGLSYEYAASALATVVAQTRQSESTVGNAFRTIFSRLQGLKLGETLEDGTDLNKYSSALATIGVNIKDQNDELKDMDTILNEIGAKWQQLSKDQQVALAQTVGGVRQYSNLIALFENWDAFQENLGTAGNASGSLDEQAERFEKSWLGAQKRVKAAWESLYQDLINSDFFIGLLNTIEKVLSGVDSLIDSMGGLKGVLLAIGALATTLLKDQIATGIREATYSLKMMTDSGRKELENKKQEAWDLAAQTSYDTGTSAGSAQAAQAEQTAAVQKTLLENAERMTAEEQKIYQLRIDSLKAAQDSAIALGKEADELTKQTEQLQQQMILKSKGINQKEYQERIADFNEQTRKYAMDQKNLTDLSKPLKGGQSFSGEEIDSFFDKFKEGSNLAEKEIEELRGEFKELFTEVKENGEIKFKISEESKTDVENFQKKIEQIKAEQSFKQANAENTFVTETNSNQEAVEEYTESLVKSTQAEMEKNDALERNKKSTELLINDIKNHKAAQEDYAQAIAGCARSITSLIAGLNLLGSALETFKNPELGPWEKFTKILMTLGMAIPMLISGVTGFSGALISLGAAIVGVEAETLSFANALQILGAELGVLLIKLAAFMVSPVGVILGSLALVATGVAMGFKEIQENSPQGKLEATAAAAKEAHEQLDEVKQKTDELTSSLKSYSDLQESLDDMDETERARAIADQNEELRELILNTKDWQKIFTDGIEYDDDTGLIKITEAQMESLKKMALQEESLARQLALETDIAEAEANRVVEDKKSDAKKISVTETGHIDAGGGASTAGWDARDYTYQSDVTTQIADALAKANIFDLKNADGHAVEEALKGAGFDGAKLDEIMAQIGAIKMDEEAANQWNALIAEHTGYLENLDAQKEAYARESLGTDNLANATPYESARQELIQAFEELSDVEQQRIATAIANNEKLETVWMESTQILEEANQRAREKIYGDIGESVNAGAPGGNVDQDELNKWLETLSDDDLKVLASLELDEGDTLDEIKAKLGEAQQIAEDNKIKLKIDSDVDEDELAMLGKYLKENAAEIDELDDSLVHLEKESKKVAHAILRFDDAIQDVTKNYDDWKDALKTGTMQDVAKAASEMSDAYGDMLDMDGGSLSADFLANAENLELMKQAAEGSEEAYNKLRDAARDDIITHVFLDDSEAQQQAYELNNVLQNELKDMEIGARIDDAGIYQQMNQLINAADMTAQEATDLLASMGVDAEVEEVQVPESQKQAFIDAIPNVTYDEVSVPSVIQDDTGGTVNEKNIKVPRIDYEPISQTEEAEGEKTVTALRVTSARKSSGGGFKFNNSSHGGGGGGGGGGSCFAPGTLVTTQNNYKNIEDIQVGDIVLSYNEKTHKNEYSEVIQTMIHSIYEKIYNLFIKNEKITATGNHKFLITRKNKKKWIQTSDLKTGDLVLLANGDLEKISNINTEVKLMTVYNFEVSNTHTYYVGENQILAHNKGGGKKGGGSGKAKKLKTEKTKDHKENIKEKDRYHNIKEKIEDLNTEMERLSKNKDRAYGKDRIKYMDQEIDRTKQQIDLTKQYIAEIQKYAKEDKAALEKTLKQIGMSDKQIAAQFDENGVLKDYEALLEAIQDKFDKTATAAYNKAIDQYNKAVDTFNKSDQGDAATEAFDKAKEALEKAEETYNKQKETYDGQLKSLSQYEDTMNLLQEKQQELIDELNDLFDKALELSAYKIELQLDISERDLKRLEWLYDNIGDSADRVADRIANLSKQADVSIKNIKTNAEGIQNVFSKLQETYNGKNGKPLIDFSGIDLTLDINDPGKMLTTVNAIVNKMREAGAEADIQTFLDTITEYEDSLMDEYSNLSDINKEITENMRDAFSEWREQLEKNLDNNDHMQDLLQSYQEIADLLGQEHMGISDEEMRQWRQSLLEIQRDAAQAAQANWNLAKEQRDKWQKEYQEALASGDQLRIDRAKEMLEEAEDFEKEAHKEFLERWKETLRTAQEIYEQTLADNEKAYQKALSGGAATSLDRLQERFDMEKKINDLYLDDYEKYKKLGDLQAKINKQLANNPNVKIQGKLKDLMNDVNEKMAAGAEISEGEATILEKRLMLLQAEDDLMAARNAKSAVRMTRDNEGNFSYTYTADTSKIEEAQENYADKFYDLLDYERQYSEDTQAAILQSYKEFLDKRNDIINDESLTDSEKEALLNQLEQDMKALVQFYTDEMDMVTDEMARLKDEDWKDMEKTLGRLLAEDDDFETKFEDTILGQIAPAWNSATEALEAFVKAAEELKAADLQAIADWVEINEESNRNVGTTTLEFGEQLTEVYSKLEEESTKAKEAAVEMAEDMIPKFDEIMEKGRQFEETYDTYLNNVVKNIDKVVEAIEKMRKALAGIEEVDDITSIFKDALGDDWDQGDGENASSAASFASGGYTGSWRKSGKLAILHQKELVLNEDDTDKMLKTVDIVRNISNVVNLNNSIDPNLFSRAIDYKALAGLGSADLQQQVHIDASFPNVVDHNEIELALNNLVNSATQYVNRKR